MKRSRGFTLVELLVVIGIIALLISILLPALSKARKQANNAKCLANLHQLSLAYELYVVNNRGRSVTYFGNVPSIANTDPAYVMWQENLRPYYGPSAVAGHYEDTRQSVRYCPLANDLEDPKWTTTIGGSWGDVGKAWNFYMSNAKDTTKLPLRVFSSYGINGWCYQPWTQNTADPYYVCSQQLVSYSQTANVADYLNHEVGPNQNLSSETPLMGDAIRIDGWPVPADQGPIDGNYTLTTGSVNQYLVNNMGRWVLNRHGRNVNMAFLDGHAEPVAMGRLWNLRWYKGWVPAGDAAEVPGGNDLSEGSRLAGRRMDATRRPARVPPCREGRGRSSGANPLAAVPFVTGRSAQDSAALTSPTRPSDAELSVSQVGAGCRWRSAEATPPEENFFRCPIV